MTYSIEMTPRARRDLQRRVDWISRNSRRNARGWRERILAKIDTLNHNPQRCAIAPDADAFEIIEVRQLLFGKRNNVYRILFAVSGDNTVSILRIMHAAQRYLNEPGDIDD